jgi:hypothetical protein
MTCNRFVVYCGYSTNKTDCHVITEILLKVALNTKKSRHNNEVESEWILFHKNKLFHSAMKIKCNITMDLHASDMLHGRHLISITKENKIYIYTQFLTQSKGVLS